MNPFAEFLLKMLGILGEATLAHAKDDEEGRHQAVLKMNRAASDEAARRALEKVE